MTKEKGRKITDAEAEQELDSIERWIKAEIAKCDRKIKSLEPKKK